MNAARPLVSLIVAMARNGVIGRDNALPWHLPADLKYFRARTIGKPILMGRRTFESLGRPLPERVNLVLTRARDWQAAGAVTVHSVDEALARSAGATELMVIGGADVFRLALPLAGRMYVTQVDADVPGDTFFPDFDASQWAELERSAHPADDRHAYPMTFVTLERPSPPWASGNR